MNISGKTHYRSVKNACLEKIENCKDPDGSIRARKEAQEKIEKEKREKEEKAKEKAYIESLDDTQLKQTRNSLIKHLIIIIGVFVLGVLGVKVTWTNGLHIIAILIAIYVVGNSIAFFVTCMQDFSKYSDTKSKYEQKKKEQEKY